jgi:hypothetical protein
MTDATLIKIDIPHIQRGRRVSTHHDPVALAINQYLHKQFYASVGLYEGAIHNVYTHAVVCRFAIPDGVTEWMLKYDRGTELMTPLEFFADIPPQYVRTEQ